MSKREKLSMDIDGLRSMVNLFNNCNETFNQRFTIEDLVKLYKAYKASEWDIPPDQWTEFQVRAALKYGTPPEWDENENPIEAHP